MCVGGRGDIEGHHSRNLEVIHPELNLNRMRHFLGGGGGGDFWYSSPLVK